MNFNVNNCWIPGLINNGLEFNGINQYLDLGNISDLITLTSSSFTITNWVKIPNNIVTSANLDIFSNGGDSSKVGTVIVSINDKDSNNKAYLKSTIISDSATANNVIGTTDISDDNWHMTSTVYHSSNTTIQIDAK